MAFFRRKRDAVAEDFSDRVPLRQLEWEEQEDGRIAVLRPKFGVNRFGRWLSPRVAKNPHVKMKLDDLGTSVWRLSDGNLTVREIGTALREQSGKELEDLNERLPRFLFTMEKIGLIRWL